MAKKGCHEYGRFNNIYGKRIVTLTTIHWGYTWILLRGQISYAFAHKNVHAHIGPVPLPPQKHKSRMLLFFVICFPHFYFPRKEWESGSGNWQCKIKCKNENVLVGSGCDLHSFIRVSHLLRDFNSARKCICWFWWLLLVLVGSPNVTVSNDIMKKHQFEICNK